MLHNGLFVALMLLGWQGSSSPFIAWFIRVTEKKQLRLTAVTGCHDDATDRKATRFIFCFDGNISGL